MIYVSDKLVDAFKVSPAWSGFHDIIRPASTAEPMYMGYSFSYIDKLIRLDESDEWTKRAYAEGVPLDDLFA